MNKFVLACIMCAALFVAPIAAAIIPHPEYFERERRRLWPFPDWPDAWEQRLFLRYFKGIDRFFPDRFPLREALLAVAKTPYKLLGESTDAEYAFRGKDNFIFFGQTLNRLQGKEVLSPDVTGELLGKFTRLNEMFRAAGAEFVIFLGPDKEAVYPENLPGVFIPAKPRYVQPLVDALHAAGIRIYDATERLRRKKSEGLLYYRTDTHWNMRGAFEAFEGFREYMGLPPLPHAGVRVGPGIREGDLISLGEFTNYPLPLDFDEYPPPLWTPPPNRPIAGKTTFVFGDSFFKALSPFFEAMFGDVPHAATSEFMENLAAALEKKPDIVVWVSVERNLVEN